jgi:hypothetical protein
MKKTLLILLLLSLLKTTSKAQDFYYGTFTQGEISMQRYDKDTSAHAVVLDEHGTAKIEEVSDNSIKIVFEYHVKIKIFDSKGFAKGNVVIALNNNADEGETLEAIKGVTTYTDDDGSIKKTELDPAKVYKTKLNKYWTEAKFAMPAIKNGCIIEYTYITNSPFLGRFPKWNFQGDIPKIHSEYDVHQPGYWTYNASLRGPLKLTKDIAEIERSCFSARGNTCDCSHLVFGMDDIPAFIPEIDMTSPLNFLSSVNFQLVQYHNLSTGAVTKYAKDWKDVDYDFKHSDAFGSQLRKKGLFKDLIASSISGKTDSLDKAKAVFEYIQKNIKWNEFYGTGSGDGIRKAVEMHSGSCADINLALIAALSEAGINAEAVILSTRDHGFINKLYPVTDDFNYVIAKVDISGKSYLLDATDPLLPFGILPLRCLNDQGRVMSLDKPSYWIDINTGQKRIRTFTIDLTLMPDGKLKGTFTQYSIGYDAYEKRKEIKRFNSIEEYVESLDEKSSKFKFLSSDISNLDSLDEPLVEKYDIEINEYKNPDRDHLIFNQFLLDHIIHNPYKLATRNYPVDKGMPSTERFSLTLHLPPNYVIDTPPQQINISLPDNGGKFETFFQPDNNSFNYSHIIQFNKAIYEPYEYSALKEFFNKIILFEKNMVTLNKKS